AEELFRHILAEELFSLKDFVGLGFIRGSLIYAGPVNDEVLAYFSKFSKKPFMFTIWDDLTDNEGVVLLQLLHEHTVILAKQVAVTAYHRGKIVFP
ncbi:hypothetical protein H5410_036679, partial [Solanum commersonii]